MELKNKRILITGGYGLAGNAIFNNLTNKGCKNITRFHKDALDLTDLNKTKKYFSLYKPEIVFHLAAAVGGIEANNSKPATLSRDNLLMNISVLEACAQTNVQKLCLTGSGCVYPQHAQLPLREDSLWEGIPEPITELYGLTKRLMISQAKAYNKQYGLKSFVILPTNLYGQQDNFHPKDSHVIPGIIYKVYNSIINNNNSVELWGNGNQTRDFLYIKDFAEITIKLMAKYNSPEPINIGSGIEVPVNMIANIIAKYLGFKGYFTWNNCVGGQQRRVFDISLLRRTIKDYKFYSIDKGIEETIEWYKNHYETARCNAVGVKNGNITQLGR